MNPVQQICCRAFQAALRLAIPLLPYRRPETVERVEDEWLVTSRHPMSKDHHIAFAALATGERVQLARQYPEWDLQVRFPARGRGTLLWYCTRHGLFYQYI